MIHLIYVHRSRDPVEVSFMEWGKVLNKILLWSICFFNVHLSRGPVEVTFRKWTKYSKKFLIWIVHFVSLIIGKSTVPGMIQSERSIPLGPLFEVRVCGVVTDRLLDFISLFWLGGNIRIKYWYVLCMYGMFINRYIDPKSFLHCE
jgi:hypothetical protein